MVNINNDKCVGCGLCVKDCFPESLTIENEKALFLNHNCIRCGHCVAICPNGAVTLSGITMEEVIPFDANDCKIDPDTLLLHLKSRRTIRNFTDVQVSKEDIEKIIEAGRYSPTGGNRQNVSYRVYMNEIVSLKESIIGALNDFAHELKEKGDTSLWYPDYWIKMYKDYHENGRDNLFFNSKTVIIVSSDSPQDAMIAAAHMETMVYSLGLGMLYSGFSVRAFNYKTELKDSLKLRRGQEVWAVLVIGHPKYTYKRTVPRKKPDVQWITS